MMTSDSNGNRAAPARGFVALCAMLALGLASMALPAAAAPFAYVANSLDGDGTVSVIDTATTPPSVVATVQVGPRCPFQCGGPLAVAVAPDGKHVYVTDTTGLGDPLSTVAVIDSASNTVVARVQVDSAPQGVAVAPDGKHVYVTNQRLFETPGTVSVVDTATNTVVATVRAGAFPTGIVVTPDGKHAYVANSIAGTVSVIDTATNTVEAATIMVGKEPFGVAVTPDGKHVYVANNSNPNGPGTVSVIDTATNTVVATVVVGNAPFGVAVTPDGKHAYVANAGSNNVSVIDTATNMVVATVPVGGQPIGVAVTPDGKHVYVTNSNPNGPGTVSVIDTATNTVEAATIMVGNLPQGVGIVPPPVGVPFLAFNAKLEIDLDRKPKEDRFELQSSFTLSSTAPRIDPVTEPVTLQVGTFSTTIPPGSFKKHEDGFFTFRGVIDGVRLETVIKRTGTLRYTFEAEAKGADLTGTKNPVPVSLTIGDDSGTTSVKADIDH
jgi:YVTN family beta-propeller protein